MEHLHGLTGSAVGHRSIVPGFRPHPGYVRRVFHLALRLIHSFSRSPGLFSLPYVQKVPRNSNVDAVCIPATTNRITFVDQISNVVGGKFLPFPRIILITRNLLSLIVSRRSKFVFKRVTFAVTATWLINYATDCSRMLSTVTHRHTHREWYRKQSRVKWYQNTKSCWWLPYTTVPGGNCRTDLNIHKDALYGSRLPPKAWMATHAQLKYLRVIMSLVFLVMWQFWSTKNFAWLELVLPTVLMRNCIFHVMMKNGQPQISRSLSSREEAFLLWRQARQNRDYQRNWHSRGIHVQCMHKFRSQKNASKSWKIDSVLIQIRTFSFS